MRYPLFLVEILSPSFSRDTAWIARETHYVVGSEDDLTPQQHSPDGDFLNRMRGVEVEQ